MRRGLTVAALAAVVTASLTACSGAGSPAAQSEGNTGFVSVDGVQVKTVTAADRTAAPELSGPKVGGGEIALSSYRGKVVVVNVWGSWCAPCRKETPDLVASAKELAKSHVVFVGLNTKDNDAAADAFQSAFKVPYPSIYDPDGKLLLQLRDSVPPKAIPSTLVLDAQGRVAAAIVGKATQSVLSDVVGKVVLETVRSTASPSPAGPTASS